MSEGMLQSFNINELAGATGLILGAVGGLLAIIWKSRCYCKMRIGCSDNCNICMCERKPPPDPNDSDDEGKDKSPKKEKDLKKKDKKVEEKDVESLVPKSSKEEKSNIKFDIDEKDNLM
jgi:hypothetical protein